MFCVCNSHGAAKMSEVKQILDAVQELKLEIESVREEQSRVRVRLTSLESHSAPSLVDYSHKEIHQLAPPYRQMRSRALMCKGSMKL